MNIYLNKLARALCWLFGHDDGRPKVGDYGKPPLGRITYTCSRCGNKETDLCIGVVQFFEGDYLENSYG